MNFKFINFNEFINSDVTKRVSIIDYSIIKSVEFILDLFEQNQMKKIKTALWEMVDVTDQLSEEEKNK